MNRVRVLIAWLTVHNTFANRSHIRYEANNTKKVVKKLVRIEANSICCRQFSNVFADCFCALHTHQLKFANFGLPCEGRLRLSNPTY